MTDTDTRINALLNAIAGSQRASGHAIRLAKTTDYLLRFALLLSRNLSLAERK